jgi:hypothetical protein
VDEDTYLRVARSVCFSCEMPAGNPEHPHHVAYRDDTGLRTGIWRRSGLRVHMSANGSARSRARSAVQNVADEDLADLAGQLNQTIMESAPITRSGGRRSR